MKRTRSFFLKIALVLTPIVLALVLIMLILSYNIIYDSNLENCERQIRNAANNAASTVEGTEFDTGGETAKYMCETYDELCRMYGITYVFAVKLDLDKNTETYLAIGFGEGASQDAIDTRYPGVTVEGSINDEEIEAFKGNNKGVILHEQNPFGDSIVCYMPSHTSRYVLTDPVNYEFKEIKTPIVVGAEISLTEIMNEFQHRFGLVAVLTISLAVLIIITFATILYFRVSRPVRRITKRMSSFVTDRAKSSEFEKLEVKGNDEFALMANSFNSMADEIDRYIGDIDSLNREKHTQEAELNIARRIQMGLLQPDHYEDQALTIRAFMLPAKDVGGDLYDYRLLDDGRVFIAISDVSGKGISASLFMARAITLLHQYAVMNYSPAQMLAEFNNTLSEQNPGGMFITAFVAIYDPLTGRLTYSNAGHNYPYILSRELITLTEGHGVAAGLFPGETYEDAQIDLPQGGTLFLYTDGVNEAKSTDNSFYSTERLEYMLSQSISSRDPDPLHTLLDDLQRFSEGAEQSDDITMLSLQIKPREELVLRLDAETAQLPRIREAIGKLNVSKDLKGTLNLAAEEIFVNICSYAYDTAGKAEIRITPGAEIEMTFIDSGKPFDPTKEVIDIDDYDHEHSIGGLGRFLTFSLADRCHYEYRDGKNILNLYFKEVDTDENHKNT